MTLLLSRIVLKLAIQVLPSTYLICTLLFVALSDTETQCSYTFQPFSSDFFDSGNNERCRTAGLKMLMRACGEEGLILQVFVFGLPI